ncbi:class I SAM-dependent DNA methyltransferase [Actinoplanes teichomyceticus]|uniref:Methyltransferase family protein n=1 Tax=Actinoplanes teichomyceticus TaxID=1867 RepID=A0A561VKV2_ACTTI|nr:class I SAM-dependent methyltransferase [Actinoplanes teichomyceticus]TWG12231.1 methyltransferase family protein [Actinoplanes teichomyceticus]GIF14167.1 methyltransferase [Actinoplanes teichomyceticus]
MDAKTAELRHAHDVLADFYVEHLAGQLDDDPLDRAMLDLFSEHVRTVGTDVADVGCGTGRLLPYLKGCGLAPRGVDLSPGMVRVARRDHPEFAVEVADLRELPFRDGELAGVVCWFSLIFLAPHDRAGAFAELARVVEPGGFLVTAFKNADGALRRGGRRTNLGVEFDTYWLSAGEMQERLTAAGFTTVFLGHRPFEPAPVGYLLVQKTR